MRRTAPALVLAAAALLTLAGCGSSVAISAADPALSVAPGALPLGISLAADKPVCVTAGAGQLCQIGVWYVNGTPDDVTIDATTTAFRDGAGTRHEGVAGAVASELPIPAGARAKVIWSVKMPYGAVPDEVQWAAADGSVARAPLDGSATPAPSGSPSASATPTAVATPSESPSPTATPSAKPTPTATPKPTKTATPKPRPTTARPRPSSTPTQPGGAIG